MRFRGRFGQPGIFGRNFGAPAMKPPTPATGVVPKMKPITMAPPEGSLPLPAESKKPLPGMEGTPILDQTAQINPVGRIPRRQPRIGGGLGDALGQSRMLEANVY